MVKVIQYIRVFGKDFHPNEENRVSDLDAENYKRGSKQKLKLCRTVQLKVFFVLEGNANYEKTTIGCDKFAVGK